MEKRFKKGEAAYLCVRVERVLESNDVYDYTVAYTNYGTGGNSFIAVIKEQLLAVDEVADESGIDWQGTFNEYSEKAQRKIEALTKQLEEANETIKAFSESENIVRTNFTAKCDEIMVLKSENERLSKQNGELGAKVDDLEADLQNAKAAIDHYHEVEHRRVGYTDRQTQAINRKDKEIEILIDRITKLEAELAEEREKNNG